MAVRIGGSWALLCAVLAAGCAGKDGVDGANGANGNPGADGTSVVATALSPGDPDCPDGGTKFVTGTVTTFACNGAPGTLDPDLAVANGTTPQVASFNVTGSGTIGGDLLVGARVSSPSTWGITARTLGLMIVPEGAIGDDGAGVLTLSAPLWIVNPAAGSYVKVAAGSYTLDAWGYLYADLPPTATSAAEVTPAVGTWTGVDRLYDGPDRIVLAQRVASGPIHLKFNPAVAASVSQSSLTTIATGFSDQRNGVPYGQSPYTWYDVPQRTVSITKRFGTSLLRITYQDTIGASGVDGYDICRWRIVVDGASVVYFSGPDTTNTTTWRMLNAAHVAWATGGTAGSHTVKVQWYRNGAVECMAGWNTTGNFLSVEEIP